MAAASTAEGMTRHREPSPMGDDFGCFPDPGPPTPIAGSVAECGAWDDAQTAAAEQVEAALAEVALVRLAFWAPHGLARSKTLTAEAFRAVLSNGMDFSPGPFLFDTGHAVAVDFLTLDS